MDVAVESITFMKHSINAHRFSVDPDKVSAIMKMKEPQNIDELRRFLGMVSYVMKFIPNLAGVLYLLHNLL